MDRKGIEPFHSACKTPSPALGTWRPFIALDSSSGVRTHGLLVENQACSQLHHGAVSKARGRDRTGGLEFGRLSLSRLSYTRENQRKRRGSNPQDALANVHRFSGPAPLSIQPLFPSGASRIRTSVASGQTALAPQRDRPLCQRSNAVSRSRTSSHSV